MNSPLSVYYPKKNKLGEVLLLQGKIPNDQLERALGHQASVNKRIGEILISLGFISEDTLVVALADQLSLQVFELQPGDEMVGVKISPLFHREHPFVLVKRDDQVVLGLSDPLDSDILSAAESTLGGGFEIQVVSESVANKLLQEHYGFQQESEEALEIDESDIEKLKDMASEAPVIKYVNNLIDNAVSKRASDIHMEPFQNGLNIRFRIDGILYDHEIPPFAMQPAIISRTKLMAGLDIAERRLPQDGKIGLHVSGKAIDLRVSTMPTVFGEGVVIRILEKGSIILELAKLGMNSVLDGEFRELITQPDGIVLVTGPTGSGKTTTLYCALHHINTGNNKIITIEDPVEYQLQGVNQIHVRPDIGLTFASGLRSIVRQDPDVIMIGEIRDLETAEIAVQSSLTGHLVFSTLHTNDAVSAVIRMVDLGVERFLLSSSLQGVIAQRLVRCICSHCKVEKGMISEFGYQPEGDDFLIYEGEGCSHCSSTGYLGRIGIYELFVINDEINRGISKGLDLLELRQLAEEQGFKSMFNDGLTKVREGVTTFAELVRVCRGAEHGAL